MDSERVAVEFSLYEMYYLQSIVRHEMPNIKDWGHPPVSADLNNQIAMELEKMHGPDCVAMPTVKATLELTRHDTLVIDFHARFSDKFGPEEVGKKVLIKAYRARKQLELGLPFAATFDNDKRYAEVKPDADPGNDPDTD